MAVTLDPVLLNYLKQATKQPTITEFSRSNFYIPEQDTPLELMRHQSVLLEYMFDPANEFTTLFYSTIKKSGKTALSALACRWASETWRRGEYYCVANDMEQARGRAYQKFIDSIELNPDYNIGKRTLPNRWKIIEKRIYGKIFVGYGIIKLVSRS